jgi:hypothetical protein
MNDIKILNVINEILPPAVDTFTASTGEKLANQVEKLHEDGRKQFESYLKSLKSNGDSLKITDKKTIEIIRTALGTFIYSSRIPMFIREMSLVYLVSAFESVLTQILFAIFLHRTEILRS